MASLFSEPIVCPLLVGREDAQSTLRRLLAGVAERGRVVLVSGEAGIGKSRLLADFSDEARRAGHLVLGADFFEQEERVPYAAIGRLLGGLAAEVDTPEARILESLAHDLIPVAPRLSSLAISSRERVPQTSDFDQDGQQISDALISLVRALAEGRTMLMVFEDLHWADSSSLCALLRIGRDAPLGCLLVLSYRDDETTSQLQSFLATLDRERLGAELHLGRLGLGDVDRMLTAIHGSEKRVRADVLHMVYQLTDGNPFFVEELVRSLVDHAGSVEALSAGRLAQVDIPRGVNEALR
ncbi:MAG TPA: AAA family ATPase, partial [Dehalococcoidia bacterium]|nr:AAA family ATPase [Dehalococcoidia bacterium]